MDRMDYLIRDSFFTGVAEGIVGMDRIIKTLNVYQDQLVVESKGIYSVEKFIVARRLMYWQVYLHKAALSAEFMLVKLLHRVRALVDRGEAVYLDAALAYFFQQRIDPHNLTEETLQQYIQLDDNNIEFAVKQWQYHPDKVVQNLSKRLLSRKLLKLEIQRSPIEPAEIERRQAMVMEHLGYTEEEVPYLVFQGTVKNQAYLKNSKEPIRVWFKNGELLDLVDVSDMKNIDALSQPDIKYFVCSPRVRDREKPQTARG